MITLLGPHMALNANSKPAVRGHYLMWQTWHVQPSASVSHIVDHVSNIARGAPGGKLRHLILNAHYTVKGGLNLGKGFRLIDAEVEQMRKKWHSLIDVIWFVSCNLGEGKVGRRFCAALAHGVGCHVVAGEKKQYIRSKMDLAPADRSANEESKRPWLRVDCESEPIDVAAFGRATAMERAIDPTAGTQCYVFQYKVDDIEAPVVFAPGSTASSPVLVSWADFSRCPNNPHGILAVE